MKYYKVFGRTSRIGYGYVKANNAEEADEIFWDCESEVDWQEGSPDTEEVTEVTEQEALDELKGVGDRLNFDIDDETS